MIRTKNPTHTNFCNEGTKAGLDGNLSCKYLQSNTLTKKKMTQLLKHE